MELRRKPSGVEATKFRRDQYPYLAELNRQALRWFMDNAGDFKGIAVQLPSDRTSDIWEGMPGIAKLAVGDWYEKASDIALQMSENISCYSEKAWVLTMLQQLSKESAPVPTNAGLVRPSMEAVSALNDFAERLGPT